VVGNRVFIVGGYGSTYFHDLSMLDMGMFSPLLLLAFVALHLMNAIRHDDMEHACDKGQKASPSIQSRRCGHRHQDFRVWRLHR
jgi:hypothetical protein